MKLLEAVEEVLKEDPRTRDNNYLWLCMVSVLRKLGFKVWIEFKGKMPSPESILKERRTILNEKNLFPQDFREEEGVTYEKPKEVKK